VLAPPQRYKYVFTGIYSKNPLKSSSLLEAILNVGFHATLIITLFPDRAWSVNEAIICLVLADNPDTLVLWCSLDTCIV